MLSGVGLFSATAPGESTPTSPVMKNVGEGVANATPLALVAAKR